jgi:hypothetical protein
VMVQRRQQAMDTFSIKPCVFFPVLTSPTQICSGARKLLSALWQTVKNKAHQALPLCKFSTYLNSWLSTLQKMFVILGFYISTFWRLDSCCDCFIHSSHSSFVPSGCASCHFSTHFIWRKNEPCVNHVKT